jgi:hypothetical protein
MTLVPGFHVVPSEEYHADGVCASPSLSSSLAQILLRESPRKAWFSHPKLNPNYKPDTDSKFDLGTCAHAVLLEDDASRIAIVEADDWRTKAAKEQRDAARASGKTPLLAKHFDAVRRMTEAAKAFILDSEIAEFWHADDAKSEVTAVWKEGSVWLRARLDRFSGSMKFIGDYKSTVDASPDAFSRLLIRMGYHIQEAFYRRACRNLGIPEAKFIFLAQSVEPPHECSLHGCDPALQQIADAEVDRAVQLWRVCMQTNKWPSYGGRIHWAMPTNYMITEHEMRLQEAA